MRPRGRVANPSEDAVEAASPERRKTMGRGADVAEGHGADPARTGSQAAAGYSVIEAGTKNESTNNRKEGP